VNWGGHLVTNWCGDMGFVRKLSGRVSRPNLVGDLTKLTGKVVGNRSRMAKLWSTSNGGAPTSAARRTATGTLRSAVVARLGDALRRLALHDPSDHRAVFPDSSHTRSHLDAVFRPRSVALIGVSANAHQLNGMPLRLLRKHGFAGEIFLVNPKYDAIEDIPCYRRIEDVPSQFDLAFCMLPAPAYLMRCAPRQSVVRTLRSCSAPDSGG